MTVWFSSYGTRASSTARREVLGDRKYILAVAAFLSIIWFVFGWKLGLRYQGSACTYWVCAINAVWIVILAVSIARCKKTNSFASKLIFHWFLFAGLGWFAFPYLGELPRRAFAIANPAVFTFQFSLYLFLSIFNCQPSTSCLPLLRYFLTSMLLPCSESRGNLKQRKSCTTLRCAR